MFKDLQKKSFQGSKKMLKNTLSTYVMKQREHDRLLIDKWPISELKLIQEYKKKTYQGVF